MTRARLWIALCLPLLTGCPGRLAPELPDDGGAVTGSAGSSGAGGAGGGTMVMTCADAPRLLDTHCLLCHGSPPQPLFANLDLEAVGVTERLVGQPAYTGTNGLCGGMGDLLEPGTLPATGIFMDKIRFTQGCGAGMPFGALTPLTAAEQECFQTWANGLVMTAAAAGD